MALYAYSVQIDDKPPIWGEVEADTEALAAELALHRHIAEGSTIIVRRVFPAPPRAAERSGEPLPLPRINYRRSLYERPTLRREARHR